MDSRQLQIVLKLQDQATSELRKMTGDLNNVDQGSRHASTGFLGMAKSIATVAAAYVSFRSVYSAFSLGVTIAADLQTAEVGLKTLLGSSEEASKTIDRLKIEAARTPFELPGLTQATQLLSSVTKDGDRSIDILLDIGEALAAMGKGQAELDRIVVNLQQVAAVGKASMIDIKQFAFAGIPIFEMLEDYFAGNATQGVKDNSAALAENAEKLTKLQDRLKVSLIQQQEFTDKTKESTKVAKQMSIDSIRKQIQDLNGTMGNLNATNGQAVSSITSVEDAIANGEVTFELLTELFDKANDEGGKFANAYVNAAGTFNQALSNMKDSFGIFMADIVTKSGLFQGLTDGMIAISNIFGDWQGNMDRARERFVELMDALDEKTGLVTLLQDAVANVVYWYEERLAPALVELWEALKPLKPLLDSMIYIFGAGLVVAIGAFIQIMAGLTLSLIEVLSWVAKNNAFWATTWMKTIDAIGLAMWKVTEFVNGLIDAFHTAIGLAKELGGGALDYVAGLLPGRASGGPVSAGQPYIVGERGPEMFVPRTSGNIVPNNALGGSGGGVNINVYGDVSGQELVDRVLEAIEGDIKRRIRVTA